MKPQPGSDPFQRSTTWQFPYYHVDAFTGELFAGNPAEVCILSAFLADIIMQKIAAENRHSETAFKMAENRLPRSRLESLVGLCPLARQRPRGREGSGPDRSMADFIWCMTAIDWGWSIEDTAGKLPEVS